jgi:hypothetical protein
VDLSERRVDEFAVLSGNTRLVQQNGMFMIVELYLHFHMSVLRVILSLQIICSLAENLRTLDRIISCVLKN